MEVRMSGGPPWGFSLVGGTDFRSPLRVGKVSHNGKAEKAGIAAGHYLLKINGVDCSNLKHMEAQRLVRSATETLELNLAVVELRRKTSQSKVVEPRRTSTSSLPRGMTSLSSYSSRFSYHDDHSAFLQSPRTSSSSIGGTDQSPIPAKPAPPPGSRPRSQHTNDTANAGKLTVGSSVVKEPSPVNEVFNKSTEDVKPPEDTSSTTTTTTTTSAVKRPPPPPAATPKKQSVTKPEVTKPVAQPVTKPVTQPVTKPVEKVAQKQPYKSPILTTSANYIPSAPKSEGGSSWYKSMFRSMLANDDNEVTIPSESVSPAKHQGKVHNAAAAFVAAANENAAAASKSISPRHELTSKPHPSVSTGASNTTSSSYKPPPASTADDTTESMTSEQVRTTLRQTIGKTTSANKGWVNVDKDEEAVTHTSSQEDQRPAVTASEDIQLDKMHPIISDAAMSSASPPPPAVNVISPVDDQVTVATTTVEPTETTSSYEPPPSDVTMVTDEATATGNLDTVEEMTSEQVRDAIRQTLSGTSTNRDWKDEDISYSGHDSDTLQQRHTPESNLQGQDAYVPDDIQLDKMHPIISDVVMSEAPPVTEDLPVATETVTTTTESAHTRINQSDITEVKLDTMHPIISEAAVTADVTVTVETEGKSTDDLMKSTSDELMSALEELNTVIGTNNTSAVGVAVDHVSHVVKEESYGDSLNTDVIDIGSHGKGSRSSSRQSDHDNRGSRSSSRQSNTSSHDNKSKKSPPAESARALYNFSAQSVKELSFKKGDVIRLTRTVDNNWLEGECDGAKGIFPTSYVELITNVSGSNTPNVATMTPEPSVSPAPPTTSTDLPHSIAKFKFQAESAKELSFQKDDILFLSKRVDDNWYKGYNGSGEAGIFPCSYVQVIVDLPEEVEYVTSPVEIYPKVIKKPKSQPPPRPSQPPPIKGRKLEDESSKPVANDDHTSSHDPTTATSFDIPGERYESLFSYEPCNSDELGLEVGDKVVVFERCDDGWFMGTCERTGEFGAFPGNFVKKLDDD